MTMSKSGEERALVERLRLLYPWFPPGHTSTGDDPPDFVHDTGNERIGLEVTRLFHPADASGEERRVGESRRARIMQRAESLAQAEGLPALDVLVYFGDHQIVDREATARQLVEFVRTHPVERTETFDNVDGLGVVRIARPLAGLVPRWTCGESGHEPVVTRAQLEATIQRKNLDLLRYRARLRSRLAPHCLHIVSAVGQFQCASRRSDRWRFEFDFDKVLLLSEPNGKVFNLQRASVQESGANDGGA